MAQSESEFDMFDEVDYEPESEPEEEEEVGSGDQGHQHATATAEDGQVLSNKTIVTGIPDGVRKEVSG